MGRILPRVGDAAEIVTLATRTPAVIVAVEGRTVDVDTSGGTTLRFELHPLTGRFVLAGEPYWGTRLELLGHRNRRG